MVNISYMPFVFVVVVNYYCWLYLGCFGEVPITRKSPLGGVTFASREMCFQCSPLVGSGEVVNIVSGKCEIDPLWIDIKFTNTHRKSWFV